MGYWEPPPPSIYDPAPRPLRYDGSKYPELEDQIIFGIGAGRENGALIWMWHPLVAHYRNLPNNPGQPRPFLPDVRGRKESERLAAYRRLIELRAPGDPEGGGLGADAIGDGGMITLNYWDLSDDVIPLRKRVNYWPKRGDVGMSVEQWNPDREIWESEGFDFERDFSNALPDILKAFQVASTAAIGALTGNAALANAWSAALGVGVKAAATRVPPDTMDVLSSFAQFAGEGAKGVSFDLGSIFGSASMHSDFVQSLQGMMEKFRALGAERDVVLSFADQLRAGLAKGADHFPAIDLKGALERGAKAIAPELYAKEAAGTGGTPPETLGGSLSFEIEAAAQAFKLTPGVLLGDADHDHVLYSIRKLAFDKGTFDATYATLAAKARAIAARDAFNAQQDKFRREHPDQAYAVAAHGAASVALEESAIAARAALDVMVKTLQARYGVK